MCDWATCNLWLHFSGTLPGSARRTGLLPVYGRNLYNWLCSFFFCSLLYLLHIDSELTQTLNYFRLWIWEQLSRSLKKKFPKTQFNPPFLWFFSPSQYRQSALKTRVEYKAREDELLQKQLALKAAMKEKDALIARLMNQQPQP